MSRKKIFLCLFINLILGSFLFAKTGNEHIVRVGYYENEIFQEGASPSSIKKGYAYEYYRKISEYTGWKYEYVYGSYSELYQMLVDGKIDLLAGIAYKAEREKLMFYPDAAMGSETYNLVKHEKDVGITTNFASLNGKSIGILDSAMVDVLEKFLVSHKINANIKKFSDYAVLFSSFDSEKIDILACESDGAYGRKNAELLCSFGKSEYFLCVNKNRSDLLLKLNEAQNQLFAEEPDYLSTLRLKYYPVSVLSLALSPVEKEWISNHSELKVGYLNSYLPYSDTDKNGNVSGMVGDLLLEIENRLDLKDIKNTFIGFDSYERMIGAVVSGKVDLIFPVGGGLYYAEENGIYHSKSVISSSTELVYLKEDDTDEVKTFAVNANNLMQYYYVITNFPDSKINFYDSIEECLSAVLNGKSDYTTINGYRNEILRNRKYRKLFVRQLQFSDDRCFGSLIGNEGLLKLVNRGISIIGQENIQKLAYKYSKTLFTYTFLDFVRDNVLIFVLIILFVLAFMFVFLLRDVRHSKIALNVAEKSNQAKTSFLNNMSHDIRTPMNAIVGFTELAKKNIDNKEKLEDYLDKITISSAHLLSLINDVLDMSRIESGKISLEENEVDLLSLIEDLKTITSPSFAEKKHTFKVDTDKIIHSGVITDKLRLHQILLNILSNAIKFTDNGGSILLKVEEKSLPDEEKSLYEFTITDNGIGISEDFQQIMFDSFTREKNSTVSKIQGTGLGLAITRKIVDMLGGTITVKSLETKGTTFVVSIPLQTCELKPVKKTEGKITNFNFQGKRILLAEDNQMNQIIAEENLKNVGFEVEIAEDGIEAVKKFETNEAGYYDIILMDIQMPKMNGYEAANAIRILGSSEDRADAKTIPIIALTANAFEEDKQKTVESGMNAHLAKPYDIPVMLEVINNLINKR